MGAGTNVFTTARCPPAAILPGCRQLRDIATHVLLPFSYRGLKHLRLIHLRGKGRALRGKAGPDYILTVRWEFRDAVKYACAECSESKSSRVGIYESTETRAGRTNQTINLSASLPFPSSPLTASIFCSEVRCTLCSCTMLQYVVL